MEAHLQGLPKPWPSTAMLLDLDLWVDRVNHGGQAMPGRRCLASRWGVGERTARTVIDRWREASPVALYASGGPAPRPAEGPASVPGLFGNMQPVGIVEAPQTTDIQTSDKNTSKPAKAGGGAEEVCADLLKAMHAIALEHDPKARLQRVTTHETRIARTLKGVAKEAKAAGKAPAELILDGWRWWWANPRAYLREQYPGAAAYPIVLQAEKVLKYASAWAEVEAARYVPTADEALDAVLEVGCAEAEARYPAAARAIRQAFDFEMGGNLARMRNPKDPDRMRAAWSAGYAKYLTPKLALVAR